MSGKLKFVIIGCGRIATLHAPGYEDHPDAELYGVCDKNEARAREFAKEFGARKVYSDYAAVLADPEVDAVELLVPHHLHCEMPCPHARRKSTFPCRSPWRSISP
ncbi:MAG TPA: Gfo/Idh/MocA family oxidoreductase, partial [Clostridia bacterium]|nr:Gfo/Idh/MocA family oxidoreductase [Clostridia bacterium]